jgi:glycogen(starch) synthase
MRVLSVGNMYPPSSVGGYELVWQSAVAQLRRSGHTVRVLTSDYRADAGGAEHDVHRELRLYWDEHRFPRLSHRQRLRLEQANARAFSAHLHEFEPDIISWWAMGGMSLSLIEQARRAGLLAVGVVCDDWMLYGPRVDAWTRTFATRPRLAAIVDRATGLPTRLRLGDSGTWLFLSETLRKRVERAGIELGATAICNRGPDGDLFRARPPRDWAWRLLYAGRIDPRKGIDTAIEAMARLPEEATLEIDGSGDDAHRRELEGLIHELGVERRVGFVNRPREEVPDGYAGADVLVFPVRWEEPWGLVPLEAMAIGTPVVATGTGGSGEYLRDGENCLLFPPSEADGLATAVRRLAADPGLRQRLREGGFETAAAFSDDFFNQTIERTLELAVRAHRAAV